VDTDVLIVWARLSPSRENMSWPVDRRI